MNYRAPPLVWVTIDWITAELVALYQMLLPLGDTILVSVDPFELDDSFLEEEDIEWDMKRLHSNCSGIPLAMLEEYIRRCLVEAMDTER